MESGGSRFDAMMAMPKEGIMDRAKEAAARQSFDRELAKHVRGGVLVELLGRVALEAHSNAKNPSQAEFLARKIETLLQEIQDQPDVDWNVTRDGGGIYIKKGLQGRADIAFTEIQEALGDDWFARVDDENPGEDTEAKEAA